MMASQQVLLEVIGSTDQRHTWSLPRCHGAATCQLQRQHQDDELMESAELQRAEVTAASWTSPGSGHELAGHGGSAAATGCDARHRVLDHDGFRPAATEYLVVDATEAGREWSFDGVSGYSVGELAPAFDKEASSDVARTLDTELPDDDATADDWTSAPEEPYDRADGSAASRSRLHTALRSQCAKLLL